MSSAVSRRRWLAKKAARRAVAVAAWASGSLLVRRALSPRPRIHALTYHRFGEAVGDPFTVGRSAFEAQMRWLASRGLPVSLEDVEGFLAGRRELREDSVLVTIDDGCHSLHREGLAVLREYAVPAVALPVVMLADTLCVAVSITDTSPESLFAT